MSRIGILIITLIAAVLVAGFGDSLASSTGCQPEIGPTHTARGSWLGADVAYSLVLPNQTTLWIFGDTFIGPVGAKDRAGSAMIANTVATSVCKDGEFVFEPHWLVDRQGDAKPIFDSQKLDDLGLIYWPAQPVLHEGQLFIPLMRMNRKTWGIEGTDLARIDNPTDRPDQWRIEILPLSSLWGIHPIGSWLDDDYLYLMWNPKWNAIATRLPISRLQAAHFKPEREQFYLSQDEQWKPGLVVEDSKLLGLVANSGLTLKYQPDLQQWFVTYADFTDGISQGIVTRTSPSPFGPWSEAKLIYSFDTEYARRPGIMCYTGFMHDQYSSANQTLVSYVCNEESEELFTDMGIYFPQFFAVSL
ncbi:MAG: DUF4185 domain-containing protein [Bdellovibrionaceae bacterium]|nr:DUF4185 domain-containing protein [Pseudobdellovibrionaceae bacterium]